MPEWAKLVFLSGCNLHEYLFKWFGQVQTLLRLSLPKPIPFYLKAYLHDAIRQVLEPTE